jgi:hypothetical protein
MEAELKQHLDDMKPELVVRLKDFVREADRDLETKVVGEFWKAS